MYFGEYLPSDSHFERSGGVCELYDAADLLTDTFFLDIMPYLLIYPVQYERNAEYNGRSYLSEICRKVVQSLSVSDCCTPEERIEEAADAFIAMC